jgi:hypothetical protein
MMMWVVVVVWAVVVWVIEVVVVEIRMVMTTGWTSAMS